MLEPAAYVPFAVDEVNAVTVGSRVSTAMLRVELHAVIALPPMSETAPGPRHRFALPLAESAVGVNTAVYVVPEPDTVPNEPFDAPDGQR
jgi:hypothetical protein